MAKAELVMSFDPLTIEHLGVKMYSTLPPVLAELIANSYDAAAKKVQVILKDKNGENKKEIIVIDDGLGMSFEEINQKFLRIGRNRRENESDIVRGRKVIGKKGLGKLSFFGIAHEIEVATRKNGKENIFVLCWDDIKKSTQPNYNPRIKKKNAACPRALHGTTIVLRDIKRETDFSDRAIASSLAKIFIVEAGFQISVQHNEKKRVVVKNELRYEGLDREMSWKIPDQIGAKSNYARTKKIKGQLIATAKPISPRTNMRGIVLFSRNKLVNLPEYFSDSTSSHIFSYLTGWLEVDFIDELSEDVISTDRQSLNWGHSEMSKLRAYLRELIRWIELDWRDRRAKIREKKISVVSGVDIPKWYKHLPPEILEKVRPVVDAIVKDAELSGEESSKAVKSFHDVVPEYPKFHWRNLHPEVQSISKRYYENGDYYTAFFEATKKYVKDIKAKAKSQLVDRNLLENVFSEKNPKLSVTEKFKMKNGKKFEETTLNNIIEGHRMLALGVWLACRCPVAHEEVKSLKESGLFTEKDCLDALSLLSHLFSRLSNSQIIEQKESAGKCRAV